MGLAAAVCATAAPAQAADVSINLPGLVVNAADPFVVSGRCPSGSETAVITVEHGPMGVGGGAVDVAPNGSWRIVTDITEGGTGPASVLVGCHAYGEGMPLAESYRLFYIVSASRTSVEIPVSVSPSRVPLGGTLRVSATCQPGVSKARVFAGRVDAHVSFSSVEAVPASDGSVTAQVRVTNSSGYPDHLAAPRSGPALVFVDCDARSSAPGPVGVGVAAFTITGRPAAAPPAVGDGPAGASPQLANTGSDAGPLAALAAVLVLTGVGAHVARRRLASA